MKKKLTKEQKQRRLLKWAKAMAAWCKENQGIIAEIAQKTGKPLPPPPPEG